jgi:hypothetical protein
MSDKVSNENWPKPPVGDNGAPRSWMVATKAFNEAAHLSMSINALGWSMNILRRDDQDGPAYLVGYYDEDYGSFHVHRHFSDGTRDVVMNLTQQSKAPSYDKVLEIMEVWQQVAANNIALKGGKGIEIEELENRPGFDRVLYDRSPS